MLIAQDKVVLIHYTLTNEEGQVLDSSSGGDPLAYIHGQGNIIPGLEKALEGRQAGDKLNVRVEPSEGYGVRDDSLIQQVPRRAFGGVKDVQPGMQFHAQSSQGQTRVVTVTRIQGDMVTVDGNHPLAGEVLTFDVEVTEVRDATGEELEHGHVHGPGGHHHHG
ncbi:MAG: peptidylprolyl isomerase [Gammaproteobacteria bacterium]|nr:peptidylprolyl isomerase [Gammaproteobacteria bacterium]